MSRCVITWAEPCELSNCGGLPLIRTDNNYAVIISVVVGSIYRRHVLSRVVRTLRLRLELTQLVLVEVFTNSPQCKNDNIANFVLAMPLEMTKTNED